MKLLNLIYSVCIVFVLVFFTGTILFAGDIKEKPEQIIKIGLLIPDDNFLEAKYAAEIAIGKANKNPDFEGYSFQLITRSMEGPWGTGSTEAVDLVFNEKVWALLGSHDGRNAHLVEQVIAKTQIPFVSAWSGDPTLSQAFVPWFFSCVPNNNQQAVVLIDEIYFQQKLKNIVTISDNEYDSEIALKSFLNELKKQNLEAPIQISYNKTNLDCDKLFDQIENVNLDGIVLFGQPASSLKIIELMKQKKMKQTVFGTLSVVGENPLKRFDLADYEGVVLVNSENSLGEISLDFNTSFIDKFGWKPGAVAHYAFDGMNTIIEAIKNSGFNKNKVKQTLANTKYNGVTGNVSFDKNGNRIGSNDLMIVKNGKPQTIKN